MSDAQLDHCGGLSFLKAHQAAREVPKNSQRHAVPKEVQNVKDFPNVPLRIQVYPKKGISSTILF